MKLDEVIADQGRLATWKRGEIIFHQGELNQSIYFVKSGLLKAFYLSENGDERIKSFLMPEDIIGSLSGYVANTGATFGLRCLKDAELLSLDFQSLRAAAQADLELANELLNLVLRFAIKKENREFEFLCLSAEQRYVRLRDTSPSLFEYASQEEIARFLGVTPVGLSRIKKRVNERTCNVSEGILLPGTPVTPPSVA